MKHFESNSAEAGPGDLGLWSRHPIWAHCGVALASLGLVSAAFHPLDIWPLGWVAFVPWMVWHQAKPRRGTARALMLAYYLHFAYVLMWVGMIAPVLVFAIPLLGMPFVFLGGRLCDRLIHRSALPSVLVYPFAIAGTEVLRDWCLGLTWSSIGYTQWRWLEGVQTAAVFRVHWMSVVILSVNAALALLVVHAWRRKSRASHSTDELGAESGRQALFASAALALFLLAATHAFGSWRLSNLEMTDGPRALGLQANIPQGLKMRPKSQSSLKAHTRLARSLGGLPQDIDLLVMAETTFPALLDDPRALPYVARKPISAAAGEEFAGVCWDDLLPRGRGQVSVLSFKRLSALPKGSDQKDDNDNGYQEWVAAAAVKDARSFIGEFHKRKLVPFGEYIPWPMGWPWREDLKALIKDVGGYIPDVTPGESFASVPIETDRGAWTFSMNICYEVVFTDEWRQLMHSAEPDFIVNVSNDGWYGESNELDLVHVATRFRAVECGRSIFRVSNTGISTSVDAAGRYRDTVEVAGKTKSVAGILRDEVQITQIATPWVRFGEWTCALFPLVLALLWGWSFRKNRA